MEGWPRDVGFLVITSLPCVLPMTMLLDYCNGRLAKGCGGSGSHPEFHWPGFHMAVVSEWQGKLANYLLLQTRTSTSGSADSVQYHLCEKTFNNKEGKKRRRSGTSRKAVGNRRGKKKVWEVFPSSLAEVRQVPTAF